MFWGEYAHQLDNKGRLIIPARFRPELSEGAIMTRGLDANLVIYPQATWEIVTQQLGKLPITHPTGRALRRLLFSGAVEITYDKQGRVLIPAYLREYANLTDRALLIGMETFVEIWEPDNWRAALDGVADVLADSHDLLSLTL